LQVPHLAGPVGASFAFVESLLKTPVAGTKHSKRFAVQTGSFAAEHTPNSGQLSDVSPLTNKHPASVPAGHFAPTLFPLQNLSLSSEAGGSGFLQVPHLAGPVGAFFNFLESVLKTPVVGT